ncbi:hypothetical protein PTKIN_Ptkin13bG0028800 [Pterospermum kingtungense]
MTMMMQNSPIFSTKLAGAPFKVKAVYRYSTSSGESDSNSMAGTVPAPKWAQKTITLPPHRRGCHLVTSHILKEIRPDLSEFKCGLAHLFLQHTSASLTINENYDSDVRDDTETFLNKIVPEVLMTCRPISNHQCLAALSRFLLQMDSLTWELGREFGFVSTVMLQQLVKWW